jgi:hypothetical protein
MLVKTSMNALHRLALVAICVGAGAGVAPQAHAIPTTIQTYLANNSNIAGFVKDSVPFGDADRVAYVNNLLGLGANVNGTVIGTEAYYTGLTDFNGSVSQLDSLSGTGGDTISGWDFLFVKYDGPNAGAFVYALNGASFTIAGNISDLVPEGLVIGEEAQTGGVSGWTAYNTHTTTSVPDGGMTVTLLGASLAGLLYLRRKLGSK